MYFGTEGANQSQIHRLQLHKTELFGHTNHCYVWRTKVEAGKPKNTIPTVKQEGGSIMLWAAICCARATSQDVSQEVKAWSSKCTVTQSIRLAKWLQDNKVKVSECPSQSPHLNPTGNLWADKPDSVTAVLSGGTSQNSSSLL